MKRTITVLLIGGLLMFGLFGCGKAHDIKDNEVIPSSYEKISMAEGIKRMESDNDFILLDVRRDDEFASGHIPGAVNLPNESIGTDEIPSLPDKSQTIYIYCRSGNRSKQAADKLALLGYTNLIEFGGILDYTGELEYGN